MRTRVRDRAVAGDLRVLKSMRATCEIDFIQFSSIGPLGFGDPKLKSLGNRHTLHEVRFAKLSGLPESVRDCRLAQLEFSVDLYPRDVIEPAAAIQAIGPCWDVLCRRLAPWCSPFIRRRVCASNAPGAGRTLYDERAVVRYVPAKRHWRVRDAETPVAPISAPLLTNGRVWSETVYYGDEPVPAWTGTWAPPEPRCQVRLYPKTTDCGVQLPASRWRARVEVRINGTALEERYGVRTVRDINQRLLSRLANDQLMLVQALPANLPPNRAPRCSVAHAVNNHVRRQALRDQELALERAPEHGHIDGLPSSHVLRYAVVPELMNIIRTPVADFFKTERRRAAGRKANGSGAKSTGHSTPTIP